MTSFVTRTVSQLLQDKKMNAYEMGVFCIT
jgi:hypothetical protein